jgi:hypothetical protein
VCAEKWKAPVEKLLDRGWQLQRDSSCRKLKGYAFTSSIILDLSKLQRLLRHCLSVVKAATKANRRCNDDGANN